MGPEPRPSVARTWASTRSAPGRSALWIDDDVGDLEQAGLFPLQVVAGFRLQQQHEHVGQVAHRRVALAGADRLDQDQVETEGLEQTDQTLQMFGHGAMAARGGQAADEDAVVVGPGRHAEAVAEQGAAASGLCGSQASTATVWPRSPGLLDQLADQRALAHAAAAGDGDHAGAAARRKGAGQDLRHLLAAGHQADQPREGEAIAAAEALQAERQAWPAGPPAALQKGHDVRQRCPGPEHAGDAHVQQLRNVGFRE